MRSINLARLVVVLLAVLVVLPLSALTGAAPAAAAEGPAWLQAVNSYRVAAGLQPVVESSTLSNSAAWHAYYMALNKVVTHDQDPSKPGYSAAGAKAGQQSSVAQVTARDAADMERAAVEIWMAAPYHAATLLEPRARSMGFGINQGYAALNVYGDLSATDLPKTSYPLTWPAPGSTLSSTVFESESPDPRAGCPAAYQGTVGSPLVAWGMDASGKPFTYTAPRLVREDGYVVELCTSPQVHGRQPFVPRYPLAPGYSYTFTYTASGVYPGSAAVVSKAKKSTFSVATHPVSLALGASQYVSADRYFSVPVSAQAQYVVGTRPYLNGNIQLHWRPQGSTGPWQPLVQRFMGNVTTHTLWVRTPERPELRLVFVPAGKDRSPAPPAYSTPTYKAPGCSVTLLDLQQTGTRVAYGCTAMSGTGTMRLERLVGSSWVGAVQGSAPLSWSSATYRITTSFTAGETLRMLVIAPDGTVLASKEGQVS